MKYNLKQNIYPVKFKLITNSKYLPKDNSIYGLCSRVGNNIEIHLKNDSLEFLVHEIVHSIDFLEEIIENRLDTESRAYLTQNLFSQALKILKKEKNNGKTKNIHNSKLLLRNNKKSIRLL